MTPNRKPLSKKRGEQPSDKEPAASEAPKGFIVGVFGVGLYVICRAIEIFLDAQSLAGLVGQSVLVEWGASRLGIVWSDPKVVTTTMTIVRRVTMGLAIGYVPAALVFAILIATRSAEIVSASHIEASVLVIGFITAALNAWRDELLHHGIVLRMLNSFTGAKNVSNLFRAVACGATSAGAALGHREASARTVFVAFCLGVIFGTLWLRDRVSAWQPFAAHTAFRFATGTLLAGGVVHLKLADNAWAGGGASSTGGMLGGTAAAIAIAPLAVFALFTLLSRATKSSEEG